MTIPDLIKQAGGPKAIALASRKTKHRVSFYAVQKWAVRGIPDEHWELIMGLAGVSLEEIYRANQEFRSRPKPPRASLVAA
jgi:hypothetical protein